MPGIAFGIFIVLHGLVHLLYFGQSARYFELQPGMTWPDGAWTFSRLLSDEATRTLASIACLVAALGFVLGGIGVFAQQGWWRPVVVTMAVFSALAYILFWNGKLQKLPDQGAIAVLINIALLAAILVFEWPDINS